MGDFGASIWGPAAIGAVGGLLGGGNQYPDWYQQEQEYWARRRRDQEGQATRDFGGYTDPETGEYVPGTRGAYAAGIEDIMNQPGYEDWEAEGLYYSPEEAAAFRYSPEEAASQRVSPQEEAGIMSLASAPVVGAMKRAEDALQRAAGARGNYYPGLTAGTQRIQQEAGRQASQINLAARLGITDMRRAGERDIAQNRIGAAFDVAGNRVGATRDIGQTRLQGRALGVGMRGNLAAADQNRLLNFSGREQPPTTEQPWWQRAGAGAAQGGLMGWLYGRGGGGGGYQVTPVPGGLPPDMYG
jgi:hypothetical protein